MILNALVEQLKRRAKHDFKGRHFEAALILQAVSWYLRYPLSYRDIEELFRERGLKVDHSTLNRWVLAYAPLIERRLRSFRKPHCGSVRIDETYIKIRGQWRYLYRALDKHGTPVDFLLTAKRDLDAATRFFRKALQDQPLLAPDRIGTDGAGSYPPAITTARKDGLLARTAGALRHQAPAARDRERSLPGQAAYAAGGLLPGLPHGPAHHPGLRGHAVAAQGLWLCRRLDGARAEPAARALLRAPAG
jgi:transposase-like protein